MRTNEEQLQHQIDYFSKEKITSNKTYHLDPWQQSYVDRFLESFPDIEGKKILDAGGGSGYMTVELAKRGAQITFTDLTQRSVDRMKKIVQDLGLVEKVEFATCDVQKLPFENNIFDIYISNAVLEHLQDDIAAVKEAERVCKQDAGMFIAVPLAFKYINPLLLPLNMFHDKRIGHLRRYDREFIEKRFPNWEVTKVYYTGHFNKVVKTVANIFYKFFDEQGIEDEDKKFENNPQGASNIIAVLKRK